MCFFFNNTATTENYTYLHTLPLHDALPIISANRDPDKYRDPDRYDVRRGARDHLAFGLGMHACLGSALARLEARVVFEEILKAMPDYEIDESGLTDRKSTRLNSSH